MDRSTIMVVMRSPNREYLGQCRIDQEQQMIYLDNAVLLQLAVQNQTDPATGKPVKVAQIGFVPISYYMQEPTNQMKLPTSDMRFHFSQVETMPYFPKKDIQDKYIQAMTGIIPAGTSALPEGSGNNMTNVVPICQ